MHIFESLQSLVLHYALELLLSIVHDRSIKSIYAVGITDSYGRGKCMKVLARPQFKSRAPNMCGDVTRCSSADPCRSCKEIRGVEAKGHV